MSLESGPSGTRGWLRPTLPSGRRSQPVCPLWCPVLFLARFLLSASPLPFLSQSLLPSGVHTHVAFAGRFSHATRHLLSLCLCVNWLLTSEKLKRLLMRVKEESEKADLKLSIQKMRIIASGPFTSWQIEGGKMETVTGFIFGGFKNHCRW